MTENPWGTDGEPLGPPEDVKVGASERDTKIRNLIMDEVAERHGPNMEIRASMTIALIEHPRMEGDSPGAPRFQVMLKSYGSIPAEVATRMLMDAQAIFKRELSKDEERIR